METCTNPDDPSTCTPVTISSPTTINFNWMAIGLIQNQPKNYNIDNNFILFTKQINIIIDFGQIDNTSDTQGNVSFQSTTNYTTPPSVFVQGLAPNYSVIGINNITSTQFTWQNITLIQDIPGSTPCTIQWMSIGITSSQNQLIDYFTQDDYYCPGMTFKNFIFDFGSSPTALDCNEGVPGSQAISPSGTSPGGTGQITYNVIMTSIPLLFLQISIAQNDDKNSWLESLNPTEIQVNNFTYHCLIGSTTIATLNWISLGEFVSQSPPSTK
jgi:hypothetical protein